VPTGGAVAVATGLVAALVGAATVSVASYSSGAIVGEGTKVGTGISEGVTGALELNPLLISLPLV